MKYKSIIILALTIFVLISIAGVNAADANDTAIASEDTGEIELSASDDISVNNLETNENNTLAQANDDEIISAESYSETLAAGQGTYSDLRTDIANGGNLTKSYYKYQNNDGGTIEITTPMTINGNGAVIDMAGSNIRAFYVTASGVTIKDLTIKNANYDGNGGAVYFSDSGTVENCNFTDNTAKDGGAVRIYSGAVANCNFNDNKATGSDSCGGAVFMYSGTVSNCSFANNRAAGSQGRGGAAYFSQQGTASNCSFTANTAYSNGGALYFWRHGNVTNCRFGDNSAGEGGAIYGCRDSYACADSCIFKTVTDTAVYVNVLSPTLTAADFTSAYGSGERLTFDLRTWSGMPIADGNITISVYAYSGSLLCERSCLSGEGWVVDLPAGSYYAIFDTEYEQFDSVRGEITVNKANSDLNISGDVITLDYGDASNVSVTTQNAIAIAAKINNRDMEVKGNTVMIPVLDAGTYLLAVTTLTDSNHVGVTKKALIFVSKLETELAADSLTLNYNTGGNLEIALRDIRGNPISNQLLLVDFIGTKTFDLTDLNGTIRVPVKGLPASTYDVKVIFMENNNYKGSNATATVTINKDSTSLMAEAVAATYNVNKDLVVTLTDSQSNPIGGAAISVDLNGVKNYITDSNGQVKLSTMRLTPKTYAVNIAFEGNDNYDRSNATTTVTISKDSTSLMAGAVAATYNANKDLVVTLTDSQGNPIKDADISVDLNGVKNYITDSNGQIKIATGSLVPKAYAAKITFAGNANYKASSAALKVTVNKAKAKITAKKKTFKKAKKVKKYTITLKSGKTAIKKVQVTLKIKGKTYKAKTNAKGKATFKIKKLTKKGTFKAKVKFAGNTYYNKATKTVKIKIR